MTRWGIGTKLFRATILYAKLALLYDEVLVSSICEPILPFALALPVASALILLGLGVYALAVCRAYAAIDDKRLADRGVYACLRHPMYAAWVMGIVPGLALLKGTLLTLTVPLAAYAFYRLLIVEEEAHLLGRFGEEYARYRRRVGGLVPRLKPAEA